MGRGARFLLLVTSIAIASAIWLPSVHLLFRPAMSEIVADSGPPPLAEKIAARQIEIWTGPALLAAQHAKMRSANAEWDFMGRSFLAWSLANMAESQPKFRPAALAAMDRIIDLTIETEREKGMYFFLMGYGRSSPWVQQPPRTLFVDGEIALMLAMRCVVDNKPEYRKLLTERVKIIARRMQSNPTYSGESYPDECWTFCNVIALAALRVSDYLNGTDHSALINGWLAFAKARLIHPDTGLLISAYRLDGEMIYRPEGSSIWVISHCLALLDEPFARRQYDLAKKYLARSCLGFGFAREWPEGAEDQMDVDSGAVVPGLGASVASSGLAFIAAGTFDDTEFIRSLTTTLNFGGFPIDRDGKLQFASSNQVGDVVVLYGLVTGPIWDKVKEGRP